jgi:iron(III) transport system substrate-binding protein
MMNSRRLFILGSLMLALTWVHAARAASSTPATLEELALYRGSDRQQILEQGARKEGQLLVYTSHTRMDADIKPAFEKKYPFIKMEVFRGSSGPLARRTLEEYRAGQFQVDAFEVTPNGLIVLHKAGILQPFYSALFAKYDDDVKEKAKGDAVYFIGVRESHIGLGFNTKLISRQEVPKSYDDLLNPKWKGKMAIAGSDTGVRWVGYLSEVKGKEFINKLAQQDIQVQNVSGRALNDLLIAGEVPLSPTIYDSHVRLSKAKGAPEDWLPLEPAITNVGSGAVAKKSAHPHAALLFVEFMLSEECQNLYVKTGYSSPNIDISGPEGRFKKAFLETIYDDDTLIKKVGGWRKLLQDQFIRK